MPKQLIINNVLYANYEYDAEKEILFLKVEKNDSIAEESKGDYEEFIAEIIGLIEEVEIKQLAYLNI
jgi:hypothetical protein